MDRPMGSRLSQGSQIMQFFLISVPFWAILGRFVSVRWVRWRPGGPKMGRWPDRKRLDQVVNSGPFWAVLGHSPDRSQGDVLTSGLSHQGSAWRGLHFLAERGDLTSRVLRREGAMEVW